MKRMQWLVVLLLCIVAARGEAREYFYYLDDSTKFYLDVCYSQVSIRLIPSVDFEGFVKSQAGLDDAIEPQAGSWGFWVFAIEPGYDHDTLLADLRADQRVEFAVLVFIYPPPYTEIAYEGIDLMVGFKEGVTQSRIDILLEEFHLVIKLPPVYGPSYLLEMTLDAMDEPIDVGNALYETGFVEWAIPNMGLRQLTIDYNCGQNFVLGGDVNYDGETSLADAIWLINYIFAGGPSPVPGTIMGDVDKDGKVSIGDAVYIINLLYAE